MRHFYTQTCFKNIETVICFIFTEDSWKHIFTYGEFSQHPLFKELSLPHTAWSWWGSQSHFSSPLVLFLQPPAPQRCTCDINWTNLSTPIPCLSYWFRNWYVFQEELIRNFHRIIKQIMQCWPTYDNKRLGLSAAILVLHWGNSYTKKPAWVMRWKEKPSIDDGGRVPCLSFFWNQSHCYISSLNHCIPFTF